MNDLLSTAPEITIFVRHSEGCPYKGDETHRGCRCRKHLRWSYRNEQHRQSAKTRSWSEAEKVRTRLLLQFGGDASPTVTPDDSKTTVKQAIDVFLTRKRTENVSDGVYKKYDRELHRLQSFLSNRSKFFPQAITLTDLEEFRSNWSTLYLSTWTRQKVQERLKGFLIFCHDARWIDRVPKLSPIKVVEPPTMPLTDKEFETLISKIPEVFLDDAKARRVRALIQVMRNSGLAIGDAATLERDELRKDAKKEIYRIVTSRQKTTTHVSVPIPDDVAQEAIAVLNGNPRYFFWTGNGKVSTVTTRWQHELRKLFRAAFGKATEFTPHCLRDTFAVGLLVKGVALEDVSKLLGHTSIKTTEKHYSPWVTARQDRLDSVVTAAWGKE